MTAPVPGLPRLPPPIRFEVHDPSGVGGVRRGLGWQLATPGWPGGDRCAPGVIGHTGFTGTGVWIDVERGRAWTLLTNRVHPSRHVETGIAGLRRAVGDVLGR